MERPAHFVTAVGLLGLLISSSAWGADRATMQGSCEARTPVEAKVLAQQLVKQSDFEHAGDCFVAAGEYELANEAFMKATRPAYRAAEDDSSKLKEQTLDQIRRAQAAWRRHHPA